jgi:hypothetical protein
MPESGEISVDMKDIGPQYEIRTIVFPIENVRVLALDAQPISA